VLPHFIGYTFLLLMSSYLLWIHVIIRMIHHKIRMQGGVKTPPWGIGGLKWNMEKLEFLVGRSLKKCRILGCRWGVPLVIMMATPKHLMNRCFGDRLLIGEYCNMILLKLPRSLNDVGWLTYITKSYYNSESTVWLYFY
jgi:hypothetical protein